MSKGKKNDRAEEIENNENPQETEQVEQIDQNDNQENNNDAAEKEIAELKDRFMRLAAEYDNFRKRSAREREAVYGDATAAAAAAFLPVYDNLERALKQPAEDEAFKKGVELTFNQLCDIFKKLNINEIAAAGDAFNPDVHNAVMHIDDENYGENVIVEVFEKGFALGDKILRHAMVKVAN